MPPSEFGIEHLVERVSDQDEGEGDDGDGEARGNNPPPIRGAPHDEVVVENPSPRLNGGISETKKGESGVRQDGSWNAESEVDVGESDKVGEEML